MTNPEMTKYFIALKVVAVESLFVFFSSFAYFFGLSI